MTDNTIASLLRKIADEMERSPDEGFKEFKWSMQQGPFRINEDGWAELCRRAADPGYTVRHWQDLRDRSAKEAEEANKLMAEMADALGLLFNTANHHCSDSGEWFTDRDENFDVLARAEAALEKYNQYKET